MCSIKTAQEEIVLEEAIDLKPFDIEKLKVNMPTGYKVCNTDGVTVNRAFSFKKDK